MTAKLMITPSMDMEAMMALMLPIMDRYWESLSWRLWIPDTAAASSRRSRSSSKTVSGAFRRTVVHTLR